MMNPLRILFLAFLCAFSTKVLAGPADISGAFSFQVSGDSVLIEIGQISNTQPSTTTGTLHVTLRMTQSNNPFATGFNVARRALTFGAGADTNGTLGPMRSFNDVSFSADYTPPPPGVYYVHIFTSQFPDLNTVLDSVTFAQTVTVASPATVRNLPLNTQVSDSIAVPGEVDQFTITLPNAGTLTLLTSGSTDTVGTLFNASGAQLATDDDSGQDLNFRIEETLPAGVYTLRIGGFTQSIGAYTVSSSFVSDQSGTDPNPPPSNSEVVFGGINSYDIDSSGETVTVLVEQVRNLRSSSTGNLTVRLFATTSRDANSGYRLAEMNIGALPAGGSISGIQRSLPLSLPPEGTYFVQLLLIEQSSSGETLLQQRVFPGEATFGRQSDGSGGDGGGGSASFLILTWLACLALVRRLPDRSKNTNQNRKSKRKKKVNDKKRFYAGVLTVAGVFQIGGISAQAEQGCDDYDLVSQAIQDLQRFRSLSDKERSDLSRCAAREEQKLRAERTAMLASDSQSVRASLVPQELSISEASYINNLAESETDYRGLKLGVGVGYSFGMDDRVDQAVIVNDTVQIASSKRNEARVFLEGHKYLACNDNDAWRPDGCGPFFAISATSDTALSGVGLGWMFGWKPDPQKSNGWAIGLGAMLDNDVSDLADGFVENQAPPEGETGVRYEQKSRVSFILFVSNTF